MQKTQETLVWSQGQEDPLEKEMATHSSRGQVAKVTDHTRPRV